MYARVRINVGRQRVDARRRALVDLSDDKVVHRHDKRHNKAAYDAGRDDGDHDFHQRFEGVCSEVESRFVYVRIHGFKLGKYAEHDVGCAKRYVSDDESQIPFGESERDEEHHH